MIQSLAMLEQRVPEVRRAGSARNCQTAEMPVLLHVLDELPRAAQVVDRAADHRDALRPDVLAELRPEVLDGEPEHLADERRGSTSSDRSGGIVMPELAEPAEQPGAEALQQVGEDVVEEAGEAELHRLEHVHEEADGVALDVLDRLTARWR